LQGKLENITTETKAENIVNQSKLKEAKENVCERVTTGIGDWLKK